MKTFDELYNDIAGLLKLIDEAEEHQLIDANTAMAHVEAIKDIRDALREYASLHLTMAPRILARGYIEGRP